MKISIVIRSYNEGKHIGRLLYGIRAQAVQPHEVIVVDSGSTDNTVQIAKTFGAKIVNIRKDIFTFGRSLNIGIREATGDAIVIVSAHVYPVTTDWLGNLVAPLGQHGIVMAYGKQRGNEVTKFSEHRVFERWFPDKSALIQDGIFCNNANSAVLKSEWMVREFDEALTGLEDLDWAKKATAAGGKISYCADACIIHVHEETWKSVRNRYRREAMAFKVINPKAKFSFFDYIYCLAGNIGYDLGVALKQKSLWKSFNEIVAFRYNQFYGTYLGYNRSLNKDELSRRFYYPNEELLHDDLGHDKPNRINYSGYDASQREANVEVIETTPPTSGRNARLSA